MLQAITGSALLILIRDYTCTVFPMGWHNNWLQLLSQSMTLFANLKLFAANASYATSAWIVVVMTTQRALSVVWPHRVNALCTQSRSWKMVLVIVVLICLTYSHMYGFGLIGLSYPQCGMVSRGYNSFIKNVWTKTFIRSVFFPLSACPLATAS